MLVCKMLSGRGGLREGASGRVPGRESQAAQKLAQELHGACFLHSP